MSWAIEPSNNPRSCESERGWQMERRRRRVCERYSERERERESESEKERVKKSDLKLINVCTVALTTAADAQVGVEQLLYCSLDDSIYTKSYRKP